MSRGYEVQWVTVRNAVVTNDKASIDVKMLGILPEDAMGALLREELEREGWEKDSDGTLSIEVAGVIARLEKDSAKVELKLTRSAQASATGYDKNDAAKKLEQEESRIEDRLKKEIAEKLIRAESEVREKIDQAAQKVYVEALKQKAASMGNVESVLENRRADGEYEITIKVKV